MLLTDCALRPTQSRAQVHSFSRLSPTPSRAEKPVSENPIQHSELCILMRPREVTTLLLPSSITCVSLLSIRIYFSEFFAHFFAIMSGRRRVTLRQVLDEVYADEDSDYDPEIADSASDMGQNSSVNSETGHEDEDMDTGGESRTDNESQPSTSSGLGSVDRRGCGTVFSAQGASRDSSEGESDNEISRSAVLVPYMSEKKM